MALIFPSLIGSDLLHVGKTITLLDPIVDGYHLDIMDNHFVPNLTFGPLFIKAIATTSKKTLWIHLMVENAHDFVKCLFLPPGSIVSFHLESSSKIIETIRYIKENKWLAGIAINPKTAVERLLPFLAIIDQTLVMSVEPGFSGQPFLEEVYSKVDFLITERTSNCFNFAIAIDGGVTTENISLLAHKGIDHIAVASALFQQLDIVAAYKELKTKSTIK